MTLLSGQILSLQPTGQHVQVGAMKCAMGCVNTGYSSNLYSYFFIALYVTLGWVSVGSFALSYTACVRRHLEQYNRGCSPLTSSIPSLPSRSFCRFIVLRTHLQKVIHGADSGFKRGPSITKMNRRVTLSSPQPSMLSLNFSCWTTSK